MYKVKFYQIFVQLYAQNNNKCITLLLYSCTEIKISYHVSPKIKPNLILIFSLKDMLGLIFSGCLYFSCIIICFFMLKKHIYSGSRNTFILIQLYRLLLEHRRKALNPKLRPEFFATSFPQRPLALVSLCWTIEFFSNELFLSIACLQGIDNTTVCYFIPCILHPSNDFLFSFPCWFLSILFTQLPLILGVGVLLRVHDKKGSERLVYTILLSRF